MSYTQFVSTIILDYILNFSTSSFLNIYIRYDTIGQKIIHN
jgi:hypothetical protein